MPSIKTDTCTHKLYVSGNKEVVDSCKGLGQAKCIENDFCVYNTQAQVQNVQTSLTVKSKEPFDHLVEIVKSDMFPIYIIGALGGMYLLCCICFWCRQRSIEKEEDSEYEISHRSMPEFDGVP